MKVKKKSEKKKVIIIIAAVIAVVVVAAVILRMMIPQADPMVSVTGVKTEDLTSTLDTTGSVESLTKKTYFSPVNASIKNFVPKVGSTVKNGELLVEFDTENLERDNKKAELTTSVTANGNQDVLDKAAQVQAEAAAAAGSVGGLKAAIAQYEQYIADIKAFISSETARLTQEQAAASANLNIQLIDAKTALEQLSTQKAAYDTQMEVIAEQIKQLQKEDTPDEAKIKELTANSQTIQAEIDKLTPQITQQTAVVNELDKQQILSSANTADPSTNANIVNHQNELEKATQQLTEYQTELAKQEGIVDSGKNAGVTQASRAQMQDNNNLAELEAASVEELLAKGKAGITSEFNGIITQVGTGVVNGAMATQGIELFTVSSNEDVSVNVTVSKYDYDKLEIGQKATVEIAKKDYTGKVTQISKVAEVNEKGVPIIRAEVTLDAPDENIFLGVDAKVSIQTGEKAGALVVPAVAVNTGTSGDFCYVVTDNTIVKREITTGLSTTDYIEVTKGLKMGDSVITELPEGLTEGMQVTPVSEEDATATTEAAAKE
ncbi:MAG: efflux RND transporter periplasmic adaptor subunit [Lachnospiraceae bacterium]